MCIYVKNEPGDIIDDTSITYNSAEYTTGYYKSGGGGSGYINKQWMTKGGTTCPSDSSGEGDVDDSIIDESSSDPSRTPYKRSGS